LDAPTTARMARASAEEAMHKAIKMAYAAVRHGRLRRRHLGPKQKRHGLELALMAKIVSPMEAITSATATSARIQRHNHEQGAVEAGKQADSAVFNDLVVW
jgi:predicted amidohydrolase YtcJ